MRSVDDVEADAERLAVFFRETPRSSGGRADPDCASPDASVSTTPVRIEAARKIKTEYFKDAAEKPPGIDTLRCEWQGTGG
jgi:hypothetical protein